MPSEFSKKYSTGLHVFGLAAFAWSLPIFIALSEGEDFFVAYRAGRWSVVAFALVAGFLIPAVPAAMVQLSPRLNSKLGSAVLAGSIAVLTALALMPNFKRLPWLPGILIITVCAMLGAVAARGYFRSRNLRTGFTLLAMLAPLYPLWFLWQSSIVFPAEQAGASYQALRAGDSGPPVVLVIFDQLSTQTLLDRDKNLNAKTFPNFARLAEHSYWFRNSSTVAEKTMQAVPAIVTGRYSEGPADTPASYASYPANAFALFDALGYDVFASERYTELCHPAINRLGREVPAWADTMKSFASDIAIVSGHIFLKEDLAAFIPSTQGLIANFLEFAAPEAIASSPGDPSDGDYILRRYRNFLNMIENRPSRFYVVHVMTPHPPFRMMKSAKRNLNDRVLRDLYIQYREDWPEEAYHAARDMQRYYHQAEYVDTLLGELLDRMEETGLYDDAYLVVTSDHGVSFRPGYGMRLAVRAGSSALADFDNAMDIVKVPTFIKLPGQRTPEIIDAPFQSIDILPTLVERILGPGAGGPFDGRPMLAAGTSEFSGYRLFSHLNEAYVEHDLDLLDDRYDVASKFDILDFDNHFALKGEYYETFAREPLELKLAEPAEFRAKLIAADRYADVDLASGYVPAYVRARIEPALEDYTPVLITVNGKFGAVARTYTQAHSTWISAVVDEGLFQPGANAIALYHIETDESGEVRCRPIALRTRP